MPPPPTPAILITGASSGLGLAFLTHFASNNPTTPIHAIDLTPLPSTRPPPLNIIFHALDITSEPGLASLAQSLHDTPICLLIHCAGIRGLVPEATAQRRDDAGAVAAAETWEVMDKATMLRTLEVNTWGTFHVLRTFLPHLRRAASLEVLPPDPTSLPSLSPTPASSVSLPLVPKVVVLSSRMGSLAANASGGAYAYRASKAGLNALVRSFSIDVPEVAFLLLHPGRVATGLVEWREEGALGVEECLEDCLRVIEKVGVVGEGGIGSGAFVDRFGERIDW